MGPHFSEVARAVGGTEYFSFLETRISLHMIKKNKERIDTLNIKSKKNP
jgi:hypothetical protein